MTTPLQPGDALGLTPTDHLLVRRLILGDVTKTAIGAALGAPDKSPRAIKAARQKLRELCRAAGTYVPEGRARELH